MKQAKKMSLNDVLYKCIIPGMLAILALENTIAADSVSSNSMQERATSSAVSATPINLPGPPPDRVSATPINIPGPPPDKVSATPINIPGPPPEKVSATPAPIQGGGDMKSPAMVPRGGVDATPITIP